MIATSTSVDTLSMNQSLQDGETLVSARGVIEVGFFSPENSTRRYLGIWYTNVSPFTVVWVANRNIPLESKSGVLKLNEKGILVLLNGSNSTIWSSNMASKAGNNPIGHLLDSGNFVVKNEQETNNFLWRSFDEIGDTMIPGMKLGWNIEIGLERCISSWKSANDPAKGKYTLKLDRRGYPQVVILKGSEIKVRVGPWNGQSWAGYPVTSDKSLQKFVFNEKEVYYEFDLLDSSDFNIFILTPSGTGSRISETCTRQVLSTEEEDQSASRIYYKHYKSKLRKEDIDLPTFDLSVLVNATENFSTENKLGEGGFRPIYKQKIIFQGTVRDGKELAVKRLSKKSEQGLDEFKNEVGLIAKLQHRNLVKLLGCCIEGEINTTPMDAIASVASTVAASLLRHLTYVLLYTTYLSELEVQVQKLRRQHKELKHTVEAAKRSGEEIEDTVHDWFARARAAMEEAQAFLRQEDRERVGCLDVYSKYVNSQRARSMVEAVREIRRETFDRVSYRCALKCNVSSAAREYVALESRNLVLKGIMHVLECDEVDFVGLYGMAGVGKTALVKELAWRVEKDGLFDVVVMATVTNSPNVGRIRAEIADGLGLKFDELTEMGRACRLRQRIRQERRILVILDDVWGKLYLIQCKLLVTSRDLNVLNSSLGVERVYRLEVLSEDESWGLFEKRGGDAVRDPSIQPLAAEVAKSCGGLSLLIVTVVEALKDKDLYAWKDALEQIMNFDLKGVCILRCVLLLR
ncbi:hypothetical protein Fmac_021181 [Flemingia macrophylla]|uniref:Bulb-type lectin domain-containing protein n=1 Tax=Flemingia macrophylla TaxID=520843 RepID=A0ABD1LW30_9FABA